MTVLNNTARPRKGAFEVTVCGEVVVSLLDMPRPFKKLRELDMESTAKKTLQLILNKDQSEVSDGKKAHAKQDDEEEAKNEEKEREKETKKKGKGKRSTSKSVTKTDSSSASAKRAKRGKPNTKSIEDVVEAPTTRRATRSQTRASSS
eukprot:m.241076 g.241076  ORF g.241076 m.241076 type:complete len:148 (+) comp17625_c0_seq1:196-639(+)